MRRVNLHVGNGVVLTVAHLRGTMISRTSGPPVFDDQSSYVLRISEGTVSIDMRSLEHLLNGHALAYDGAPLSDVSVAADGDRLEMKGKMHKGITVPFSTKLSVAATSDGRMKFHAESMKTVGIPTKGLLDLLGLELDDLVDLKDRRGMEVQEDDLIIAPGKVLPPPEMQGRLTRVQVRGDQLVQTFASGTRPGKLRKPRPSARGYIYFGGGDIRIGKLTMHDADLQLIDDDPKDPFDFFPAEYDRQLVAGYSKYTPEHGLMTFMPDYNDLPRRSGAPASPPAR